MMKCFTRLPLSLALGAFTLLTALTPLRAQVLDRTFAPLDSRANSPASKGNVVRALT
ncbi:MAG: hypothetical protein H7330_09015, partial [Hymenobacteraceae bacterium]|nr:hypothetical protein [Hymenobacteraceae bacterium]